jgi:putative endonuclease
MPFCYILYSKQADKYYIGKTNESLDSRLKKHLKGYYGNRKYTAMANDWEIFWNVECNSNELAERIERHLKGMKSRKYLEKLNQYPELSEKLIARCEKTL